VNKKGGGPSSQIRSGTPVNYAETLDFFESFGFFYFSGNFANRPKGV